MAKPKPQLIFGVVIGTLVVAAGVLVPWYFFVYKNNPYPTWDLEFFGDTVVQSVNVTYGDIRDKLVAFDYSFNYTRWWSPDGYLSEIRNYTGIPLWDLIEYSGVNYGSANALRFVAADDYTSAILSLDVVENNKSLIIVCYEEEGELLTGPEDAGDGYLMSAVNYSINENIKSSQYTLKWLIGIEFLVDWDVTLFGDTYVEENKTISYYDIVHSPELDRYENVLINYTKLGISSELLNVSGVSLWSIIQYTEVNYTTASGVNFTASDWNSYTVSLDWVENNASKVLIVYALNGELLNPDSDGFLISLVDYTLTVGTSSSKFKAKFLSGIEFTMFL